MVVGDVPSRFQNAVGIGNRVDAKNELKYNTLLLYIVQVYWGSLYPGVVCDRQSTVY